MLQGLDFDRDVAAVVSQPFELSYFADGKRRRHVPDFFVRCVRGPDRVVDVKPAHKVDEPHNARSFQAMGEACAEAGWEYVVATEPDPVFHANISWLAGYKGPPALLDEFVGTLLEVARGGITVEDLLAVFEIPEACMSLTPTALSRLESGGEGDEVNAAISHAGAAGLGQNRGSLDPCDRVPMLPAPIAFVGHRRSPSRF